MEESSQVFDPSASLQGSSSVRRPDMSHAASQWRYHVWSELCRVAMVIALEILVLGLQLLLETQRSQPSPWMFICMEVLPVTYKVVSSIQGDPACW